MAGDWIKMRVNLTNDPNVRAISRALKIDTFGVVGRLHALWAWADEHSLNGEIKHATEKDVDDIAGKVGFASALIGLGWLIASDSGVSIPNFDRHNGDSAKRRAMETERKRREREKLEQSENCPDSVTLTCGQNSDTTVTREEKRREEKSNTVGKNDAVASPHRANSLTDEEFMQSIKSNPSYAGIDVDREYGKCVAWCQVNRKQPSQRRFTNWMNRVERPMQAPTSGNNPILTRV